MMKSLILIYLAVVLTVGITGCNRKPKSDDNDMTEIQGWMEEFKNRKIYTELDAVLLTSISDEKLEQVIMDFISSKFSEDYNNEYQVVGSLSPGLQAVYSTWWVEAEVNNGGFNQYYWNSSGQFAKEAEAGFLLLGATDHLELMKEANKIHAEEERMMQKYKDKGTIEAFSESYQETKLNNLDERFYELDENLSELRIKYIRSHIDEFISK